MALETQLTVETLRAGDVVGGKYRLEKLLGEGAMGSVWAARNQATDRAFAIKFMLSQYTKDPVLVQRFLNEARICGRLDHPSLVEIYDLGVAEELGDAPFLVMELLRGEGLDQVLARSRRMDPRKIGPLMLEVARGLDLAHEAGIVHRDIKSANLFLHRSRSGEITPKILDFGVSKNVEEEDLHLTRAGALVGSPLYMSPEQASGKADIDPRSDVWSLGVILYQTLAGVVPFNEPNYNAVLSAILARRHRPLVEVVPGLLPMLSETVDLCLVKDRNRRMASAAQLAARLEDVLLHFEQVDLRATEPEPEPAAARAAVEIAGRATAGPDPASTGAPPSSSGGEAVTEVMDRSSLPREVLDKLRRTSPDDDVDVYEDDPQGRSVMLRRAWLADLARSVSTQKTDDIRDDKGASSGKQPARAPAPTPSRPAPPLVVEESQEGEVAETDRAIRLARDALRAKPGSKTAEAPARAPASRARVALALAAGLTVGLLLVALLVLGR